MNFSRYYEILGVNPNSPLKQIKLAYKDLVKVWHPDRFLNDPRLQLKAQEKLKEINIAYKELISYLERKRIAEEEEEIRKEELLRSQARQKEREERKKAEEFKRSLFRNLVTSAKQDLEQKRLGDALEKMNSAMAINSEDSHLFNLRGTIFSNMGRYNEAIIDFSRAIELDSKEGRFYFNRGIIFGKLKNKQNQLEDFRKAARMGNEDAQLWLSSRFKKW